MIITGLSRRINVVFGTPVIVTDLGIARSTANVGARLASFYYAWVPPLPLWGGERFTLA
jgi:hypothetical protein